MAIAPRGYAQIDPRAMFCEVHGHASALIGTTLYIDGGTFHYDNGTQNVGPNMWLRAIDTSKSFKVASKTEAPVTYLERPKDALELDMHALWRTPEDTLLQLFGVYDASDLNFPGFTPDTFKTYHDIWRWNNGNLVHIPVGGKDGILLAFGGQGKDASTIYDLANGRGVLTKIEIYDTTTQSWMETQTATGEGISLSRMYACTVVAPSQDGSSYNIYMFGGGSFNLQNFNEDVWVLSVPSFRWFPVYTGGSDSPLPREAMSCSVVGQGKRTMMVYGGRYRPKFSRPCDSTGIFAFDMTGAAIISNYIGGGPSGGATRGPVGGFADPDLATYFAPVMNRTGTTSGATTSKATPSGTNQDKTQLDNSTGENSSKEKPQFPLGVIIAIVLGSICLILIIAGGIYFQRRLKKQSRQRSRIASSPPQNLDSKEGFPLEQVSTSCQKFESSTPHYDPSELPVMGFPSQTELAATDFPEPQSSLLGNMPDPMSPMTFMSERLFRTSCRHMSNVHFTFCLSLPLADKRTRDPNGKQHCTMDSLNQCPMDVFLGIMHYLRPKDLRELRLVSKSMSIAIAPILFRRIKIDITIDIVQPGEEEPAVLAEEPEPKPVSGELVVSRVDMLHETINLLLSWNGLVDWVRELRLFTPADEFAQSTARGFWECLCAINKRTPESAPAEREAYSSTTRLLCALVRRCTRLAVVRWDSSLSIGAGLVAALTAAPSVARVYMDKAALEDGTPLHRREPADVVRHMHLLDPLLPKLASVRGFVLHYRRRALVWAQLLAQHPPTEHYDIPPNGVPVYDAWATDSPLLARVLGHAPRLESVHRLGVVDASMDSTEPHVGNVPWRDTADGARLRDVVMQAAGPAPGPSRPRSLVLFSDFVRPSTVGHEGVDTTRVARLTMIHVNWRILGADGGGFDLPRLTTLVLRGGHRYCKARDVWTFVRHVAERSSADGRRGLRSLQVEDSCYSDVDDGLEFSEQRLALEACGRLEVLRFGCIASAGGLEHRRRGLAHTHSGPDAFGVSLWTAREIEHLSECLPELREVHFSLPSAAREMSSVSEFQHAGQLQTHAAALRTLPKTLRFLGICFYRPPPPRDAGEPLVAYRHNDRLILQQTARQAIEDVVGGMGPRPLPYYVSIQLGDRGPFAGEESWSGRRESLLITDCGVRTLWKVHQPAEGTPAVIEKISEDVPTRPPASNEAECEGDGPACRRWLRIAWDGFPRCPLNSKY
ncbi:hypothetical protein DFH27DRAFT_529069 [Peziza echinospora]|nr:hypothetical protein DFH27DRAFT_529069 [Peziza echinospora]